MQFLREARMVYLQIDIDHPSIFEVFRAFPFGNAESWFSIPQTRYPLYFRGSCSKLIHCRQLIPMPSMALSNARIEVHRPEGFDFLAIRYIKAEIMDTELEPFVGKPRKRKPSDQLDELRNTLLRKNPALVEEEVTANNEIGDEKEQSG